MKSTVAVPVSHQRCWFSAQPNSPPAHRLQAGLLSELEGSALVEDQAGCGPAFRVLKTLAHNWMDDASKRNNMCAA